MFHVAFCVWRSEHTVPQSVHDKEAPEQIRLDISTPRNALYGVFVFTLEGRGVDRV